MHRNTSETESLNGSCEVWFSSVTGFSGQASSRQQKHDLIRSRIVFQLDSAISMHCIEAASPSSRVLEWMIGHIVPLTCPPVWSEAILFRQNIKRIYLLNSRLPHAVLKIPILLSETQIAPIDRAVEDFHGTPRKYLYGPMQAQLAII